MSYPPTPDQVWDITAPLDSSAANLIGQDIRNLTNEVMQRMALLSGTIANRPTPETVNATWGGAGFGILYFALDINKVYQWNGSAWTDVSGNLPAGGGGVTKASNSVLVSTTNPANNTSYNSASLPADVLSVGSVVEIDALATVQSTAGPGTLSLDVGTTTGGFTSLAGVQLVADSNYYNAIWHYKGIVTASGYLAGVATGTLGENMTLAVASVFQVADVTQGVSLTDVITARIGVHAGGFTGVLETIWTILQLT